MTVDLKSTPRKTPRPIVEGRLVDNTLLVHGKSWARLIQKIYEADPLVCPKCQGSMRIISFIEDPSVIRDILNHLGLWLTRAKPPPKAHAQWGHDAASCPHECAACDLQLQTHADTIYGDPVYSWDAYIHA